MTSKLAPVGLALLLAAGGLIALACGDDEEDGGSGGRGGRGGAAGTAGAGGAGTGGGGSSGTAGTDGGSDARTDAGVPDPRMNFFVSSEGSATGDLGGLAGADARCQSLAAAVGRGGLSWRAYLSAELADGGAVHAAERIGSGPWYNFYGALLASDLASLHARTGDAELFVDEHGNKVPGQWPGSPRPIEHDILTGTNSEGGVAVGFTCSGWTSNTADAAAMVGHSDGLGPDANANPPFSSWHSSHPSAGCNDTAPRGGSGRIYCFAPAEVLP